MKALYVNINNEQIQSTDSVDVFNYSLLDDFFFYLGDAIVGDTDIKVDKIGLIKDFNTPENSSDFDKLLAQWEEFKIMLFDEFPKGEYKVILPERYIDWLQYHDSTSQKLYNQKFENNRSSIVNIDVKSFYNDCFCFMKRKILHFLRVFDVDFFVFGELCINTKFELFDEIRAINNNIFCVPLSEWQIINEIENDHAIKFDSFSLEYNFDITKIAFESSFDLYIAERKLDEYINTCVHVYYTEFVKVNEQINKYLTVEEISEMNRKIHEEMLMCFSIVNLSDIKKDYKSYVFEEAEKSGCKEVLCMALHGFSSPGTFHLEEVILKGVMGNLYYSWKKKYFFLMANSAFHKNKNMYKLNFLEIIKSVKQTIVRI